ncbi:MAG: 2-dehydro-3-deoxyphosphooctonate aldolase [Syntrophomonadaceae bacterium]|nr:2-dehydro-3-deoxyphosphooctonate aldolase [Bacillota bacterium]
MIGSKQVKIGDVSIGSRNPLVLIAGPCVLESEILSLQIAQRIKKISEEIGMPFIFKASYDKGNRTSINSFRGPGIKDGLKILARVRKEVGVPVTADVHCQEEIEQAARTLDLIQIPAFLCRQTALLLSAGYCGKAVNIKKGQFLAPEDMENVIKKVRSGGNENIILTERGTSFGYHNLIADMRSLPIMRSLGCPVIFDATHSVQLPGSGGDFSGGEKKYIEVLARAAVAAGCDGLFLEVHTSPETAPCDGQNMLTPDELKPLLERVKEIDKIVKKGKKRL